MKEKNSLYPFISKEMVCFLSSQKIKGYFQGRKHRTGETEAFLLPPHFSSSTGKYELFQKGGSHFLCRRQARDEQLVCFMKGSKKKSVFYHTSNHQSIYETTGERNVRCSEVSYKHVQGVCTELTSRELLTIFTFFMEMKWKWPQVAQEEVQIEYQEKSLF